MVFVEYTNEIFKIDSQNLSEIVNSTKQKFNITNFYFTLSGKIVLNNTTLKDNDILNVNLRLNGGFKKVLEKVLDPIIKPLLGMAAAVVGIVELIIELALLVPKILELMINVFSPDKLINDIIYGVTQGITYMISTFFGGLISRPKKSDGTADAGNQLFGSSKKAKVVCIKPTTITLLILILCPPLALLLHEGIKAWYLVVICALMTYFFYYIPGFIFAALHILC